MPSPRARAYAAIPPKWKELTMAIKIENTWNDIDTSQPGKRQYEQLHKLIERPPPGTRVLTITPELAEEILKRNARNRGIRRAKVKEYAKAMEEGRWQLNGDNITFGARQYILLDGQHRLHACVLSGVSFVTDVRFGINEDFFTLMDNNIKRGNADILKIAFPNMELPKVAASAARWVYLYTEAQQANDEHKGKSPDRGITIENDLFLSFYKDHIDNLRMELACENATQICLNVNQPRKPLTVFAAGQLAGHLYLYNMIDNAALLNFQGDLLTVRAKPKRRTRTEILVEKIVHYREQKRVHENQLATMLNYTFNAYVDGKTKLNYEQVTLAFPFIYPKGYPKG